MEEKKQYYMNMMKAISEHKDFGKRNPVDIGIDCGFTETEVLELIEMLQEGLITESDQEVEADKQREKYYFLIQDNIVSVNIKSWNVELAKKVFPVVNNVLFDFAGSGETIRHWYIKNNIFVYTLNTKEKEVFWENLDTGEQRKFLTDENVNNILIRKSDVCIMTRTDIILWKNDGTVLKKENACPNDLLIEADDYIYAITDSSIYKIDGDLNKQKIWSTSSGSSESRIDAVEYFNGKLSWYQYYGSSGVTGSYHKYTEGEFGYSTDAVGIYAPSLSNLLAGSLNGREPLVGAFTKNYRLLQNEIWSIDNKHKICDFNRDITKKTHEGQVIAIPDKDIFIGIGKDEENLIKIDLCNERQPVVVLEIPKER